VFESTDARLRVKRRERGHTLASREESRAQKENSRAGQVMLSSVKMRGEQGRKKLAEDQKAKAGEASSHVGSDQ